MHTLTPARPHGWSPSSRSEPATCETDSTTSASAPRPSVGHDNSGGAFSLRSPRPVGGHAQCSCVWPSFPGPADRHSLCRHKDAEPVPLVREAVPPRCYPAWDPEVSHRELGPRSRLATAGFHARRRADFVCSPFFPRSVGFGPTASWARGAFTIAPSMLCHFHATPSISSYSASPLRQSLTKTPARFQCRKYWCTELALPNSDLGNAFHWHPVRSTNTIPAKTFRGIMGLRPPPGCRKYFRPFSRFRFGIRGSTFSHNSSETVHDLVALMRGIVPQPHMNSNSYLRISS